MSIQLWRNVRKTRTKQEHQIHRSAQRRLGQPTLETRTRAEPAIEQLKRKLQQTSRQPKTMTSLRKLTKISVSKSGNDFVSPHSAHSLLALRHSMMIKPKSIVQLMVQGPDERRKCHHLSLLSENPPIVELCLLTYTVCGHVANHSSCSDLVDRLLCPNIL